MQAIAAKLLKELHDKNIIEGRVSGRVSHQFLPSRSLYVITNSIIHRETDCLSCSSSIFSLVLSLVAIVRFMPKIKKDYRIKKYFKSLKAGIIGPRRRPERQSHHRPHREPIKSQSRDQHPPHRGEIPKVKAFSSARYPDDI